MGMDWRDLFVGFDDREDALQHFTACAEILALAWCPESLVREKIMAAWLLLREATVGETEGGTT